MTHGRLFPCVLVTVFGATGCFNPTGERPLAETATAGSDGSGDSSGSGSTGDVDLQHAVVEAGALDTLAAGAHYEGWALIDGAAVSIGKFNVDASGVITNLDGIAIEDGMLAGGRDLRVASEFILTIEAAGDVDINPGEIHYLSGDLVDGEATLVVDGPLGLAEDFSVATAAYSLETPTNGPLSNESSGIWFFDPSAAPPTPSLVLPTLPAGWFYEGWVVVDGTPLSTGRFLTGDAPDSGNPFSGPELAPPVPGEDFLFNAPPGLSFPISLQSTVTMISVEPEPDDSPAPFTLRPLRHDIPADAVSGQSYAMDNETAEFPTLTLTLVP